MAIWAADVCSRAARQLICIEPTGLRLRCIGKTDPQCGTVQFCFHSDRLTCSARTGFRAVTTPLGEFCRRRACVRACVETSGAVAAAAAAAAALCKDRYTHV